MNCNLEGALQLAHRHVADGSGLVDAQCARLAAMRPGTRDAIFASELLATMKSALAAFTADLSALEARSAFAPGQG